MYVISRKLRQKFLVRCGNATVVGTVIQLSKGKVRIGFEQDPKGGMFVSREEAPYQGRPADEQWHEEPNPYDQYANDFVSGLLDDREDNA